MLIQIPFVLALLSNVAPSDANLFARGSDSLRRVHHHAAKRSASFARDLRTTFGSIFVEQNSDTNKLGSARVYCVSSPSNNGTSLTNGTSPIPSSPATFAPTPSATGSQSNGTSARPTSSASGASPSGTSIPSSPWKVVQSFQGNSFFTGWDFFTGGDPTNGQVTYVDQSTAQKAGLVSINSAGNAIMRVETTAQVATTRQSVRITTSKTYTGGLVIMDSVHMPTGCGTWPAFWSNGPNWPAGGEIDIVEGVNDYTNNQATIHTNPGCTIPTSNANQLGVTGTLVGGTNCAAAQTGNQGCGVRASQTNSFGAAFNNNGGGVYAMQWDNSGISIFFFPRNSVPSDITNSAPQPDSWGQPMAFWPSSGCDPFKFFYQHSAIFDTTLCGDWASSAWTGSGIPGQEQSCAQRTGVSTCEEFIRNNGAAFNEAYWEVKSVKIYQTS
ncbi:hypothetical protein QCA50_001363 [Cerrena zonata]|uniref:GH16 domain-containing protein n=1 Tax=Cerrena zonata TaxID=2478898 RepID=A0AAW0GKS3_9APHY